MNDVVRDMWKAALTSGEFEQGIGQLKAEKNDGTFGYCCLGVLTELYHRETGKGRWGKCNDGSPKFITEDGEDSYGFLVNDVRKWAGLSTTSPTAGNVYLHVMNDTGKTFAEIAEKLDEID